MNVSQQTAKHFKDVHFGGNWTSVNLQDTLADVSWQQAVTKVYSFNTIAALVYHMNYYVGAVLKVLQGEPLTASDTFSFDLPAIQSEDEWKQLLNKTWADAANFANLLEQLPESRFGEMFTDEKYGTYYRNMHGIIEHIHYHLGQIVFIKKIIQQA
ncbi:MAG: DinB family protein [Ferruginibacter sp.]